MGINPCPKSCTRNGEHANALDDQSTFPSPDLFERPPEAFSQPLDARVPIMARLPFGNDEYQDPVSGTQHQQPIEEYIHPRPDLHIAGALPYNSLNKGLTYTVSRLPVVDDTSRALWAALHSLRPLTTDYAARIESSSTHTGFESKQCPFNLSTQSSKDVSLSLVRSLFNWSSLKLPSHMSGTFYGVVFRSNRALGSESTNLYLADKLAHEEAVHSGGLLMYFYGDPDPQTGVNLATCIWSSRKDARDASKLPMHRLAVERAKKAYSWFALDRYSVVKHPGEEGLRIESWTEGGH